MCGSGSWRALAGRLIIATATANSRLERVGAPELKAELRSTVGEAVALIRALPPERLGETIRPQGYEGTVLAAIYHVVEHFAGHAFQIMFATKLMTSGDLGFYTHLSRAQAHQEKLP